ncbi:uncharacterized protein LOC130998128 [Salvia miltiorrhiza]|uniref:uncharacterized protein LOC130998128 n=1 Tax=Salvia miltiorrhiza TaxID=226208 RepID=UPI0025AD92F5|nr:uncharacterized protein LOC130998128 [Salvia miltiorrhiza]
MEDQMANLHISEEDDELVLDDEITGDSNVTVDLCLVGRFLTDQTINFPLMRSRLASVWRPGKGVFVKDIGQGRYIFQFFHEIDLIRVYDGGPWAFGNFPLILHRLKRGEFPLQVPLDHLSFWVQIHDLPAGFLTEGVGRVLGNFIGKFLEYDSTNSSGVWRQYMRVRCGICVDAPLKRFKKLKHKDGTSFVVNFKYERLNIFCFLCGRLGHSESFCELIFDPKMKESDREWGVWLKAADRRGLTLAGDKWIRGDESVIPKDPIPPQSNKLVLRDTTNEYSDHDTMMIDNPSADSLDERKRRRGINIGCFENSSTLDTFPTGLAKDGSGVLNSSTAGSGVGASRSQ